jgi:anionic cell wall polymer biosynthesis LytR-Cps2A-Psr (LCP) family protein
VASLGGIGYLAYEGHLAARLVVNPIALIALATLCGVLAILMTGLVVATYVALRPGTITVIQRIIGAIVVGVLCFVVVAPLAVVATAGYAQAKLVTLLFRATESQTRPAITPGPASDLWANTPRINVLLVGGDASGTTDTMIVASIDTKTGNTILITVPRDTARLPFPASSPLRTYFPDGYWDGTDGETQASWADRIWTDLPKKVPSSALGATTNLSADALKQGIGEALGLRVDYYLYADVASLYTLVDALGGVSMTVGTRIPTDATATSWIEPGPNRHLDAYQALWYGWSSTGTDADRQSRRGCVIDAMTRENPVMVLARFDGIAQAGTAATTDIPSSMLPMMVELATRVKRTHVTSLQFANGVDGFVSANPNFPQMRQRVAAAVAGSLDPVSAQASTAVSITTQCGA